MQGSLVEFHWNQMIYKEILSETVCYSGSKVPFRLPQHSIALRKAMEQLGTREVGCSSEGLLPECCDFSHFFVSIFGHIRSVILDFPAKPPFDLLNLTNGDPSSLSLRWYAQQYMQSTSVALEIFLHFFIPQKGNDELNASSIFSGVWSHCHKILANL